MSLRGLMDVLAEAPAYRRVSESIAPGENPAATAPEAAKPMVIASLWRDLQRPLLVVCPHPDDARRLVEQLEAYCDDETPLLHFAEAEVLPYERLSVEAGTVQERMRALGALRGSSAAPPLIVASVTGLLQKTISPDGLRESTRTIARGESMAVEASLQHWTQIGYRVGPLVDHPGTAARRGGIVDVYGPGHDHPVRLDLWGDEVDTIRLFDPNTQRSGEHLDAVTVLPAAEVLPALADKAHVDELVRGLDFSNTDTSEREPRAGRAGGPGVRHLVRQRDAVRGLPAAAYAAGPSAWGRGRSDQRAVRGRGGREARGGAHRAAPPCERGTRRSADGLSVGAGGLGRHREGHRRRAAPAGTEPLPSRRGRAGRRSRCRSTLRRATTEPSRVWRMRRGAVVLGLWSLQRSTRNACAELLADAEVGAAEMRSLDGRPGDGVAIVHTTVAGGWSLAGEDGGFPSVTLLSDAEVFGTRKQRVTRPRRHSQPIPRDHCGGDDAGRVRGARRSWHRPVRGNDDQERRRRHGGGRRSRVPGTGVRRRRPPLRSDGAPSAAVSVRRRERDSPLADTAGYAGVDAHGDAGSRVDAEAWRSICWRLYAQRESAEGFPHDPDSPWQDEMEDAFPYVETPDQQAAIDDVKTDMEMARPMDRLVCRRRGIRQDGGCAAGNVQGGDERQAGGGAGAHNGAGATALPELLRAHGEVPHDGGHAEPVPHGQGAGRGGASAGERRDRRRHRHA